MSNLLVELSKAGVSPWLDNLKREMFASGELKHLIAECGVRGQTSNPSIFQNAITKSAIYNDSILELSKAGLDAEGIVWNLMIKDVQAACDEFLPLYEKSGRQDGFVSLELNPTLAHETEASLVQAREIAAKVNRPNLMIKVPATPEGMPVVSMLIAEGYNVNVTLLFSVAQYAQVIEAWLVGLEKRAEAGLPLAGVSSVASFFVSRVDSEADKRMDAKVKDNAELEAQYKQFRGQIAVANARAAYQLFTDAVCGPRWEKLKALGASVQRPLWASTSTKNPEYHDTLYVDELIGANCVNTMPDDTVAAFSDHGVVANTLTAAHCAAAKQILEAFAQAGFDLDDITNNTLMSEGVEKFAVAYNKLVEAVQAKTEQLQKN